LQAVVVILLHNNAQKRTAALPGWSSSLPPILVEGPARVCRISSGLDRQSVGDGDGDGNGNLLNNTTIKYQEESRKM
jgi:hypothetical protein